MVQDGAALSLRGIRKAFGGIEVLHGVDLDLVPGKVLALLGENGAGKSTLVKVVAGDYRPDAGRIVVDGRELEALDPIRARALGIRMIFQELTDAPELSVAENILLGQLRARRGVVNWSAVRAVAAESLDALGVTLDLDTPTGSLGVGERQMVEIARAIADDARILVLDEPTAALSSKETEHLFALMRRLRARGTALVYITHRLDEVAAIGDRVLVLRDGNVALEADVSDVSRSDLVVAMIGHRVSETKRDALRPAVAQDALLHFEKAGSRGAFADVTLDLGPGEVLALYGRIGSGIEPVMQAAFGVRPLTSGLIAINGDARPLRGPTDAMARGIGLLAGDRQQEGVLPVRSVAENLSAPSWRRLAWKGFALTAAREGRAYRRWHDALRIRSSDDPGQTINTLSGGNQQKVLLGRWFERRSTILLLVEPTRGVDIGARQDIYRSIRDLANEGTGVLIASSDHEEVEQVADRAVVMARRRVVAHLDREQLSTRALIAAAGG